MYTSAEIQLLRNADPGVKIPGVDIAEGNPLSASALKPLSSLSTSGSSPVYYQASTNTVIVKGVGAVLSGYNIGSAQISICAANVTINDCTFSNPSAKNYFSIADEGNTRLVVENCTFTGGVGSSQTTSVFAEGADVTVTNNKFVDTSGHAVQIDAGVIAGNYFAGGGYGAGVHADAIQIENTSGPLTICGNFIDWTNNPDALEATNNAIRISTDCGNTSNVTITGNVMLGGGYTVTAGTSTIGWLAKGATGTLGTTGVMSNVNITGNYIGWGGGGAFYPTTNPGINEAGNTIVDYSNPIYAANAWTAYQAAGVGTNTWSCPPAPPSRVPPAGRRLSMAADMASGCRLQAPTRPCSSADPARSTWSAGLARTSSSSSRSAMPQATVRRDSSATSIRPRT